MLNDAFGVWDRRRAGGGRFSYADGVIWHLSFVIQHSASGRFPLLHRRRRSTIEVDARRMRRFACPRRACRAPRLMRHGIDLP